MENENLSASINLLKLEKATVCTSKAGTKFLAIPIEENDLYVKADESGKATHVCLSVNAWRNKDGAVGQFGDTHYILQNFSEKYREAHKDDAEFFKNKPFLGNARPIVIKKAIDAVEAPVIEVKPEDGGDDLPF